MDFNDTSTDFLQLLKLNRTFDSKISKYKSNFIDDWNNFNCESTKTFPDKKFSNKHINENFKAILCKDKISNSIKELMEGLLRENALKKSFNSSDSSDSDNVNGQSQE